MLAQTNGRGAIFRDSDWQAPALEEQLDAATSVGNGEKREVEGALNALKYELHVQGREGSQAVKLCRSGVKELAAEVGIAEEKVMANF